jgi:hypothetical protein
MVDSCTDLLDVGRTPGAGAPSSGVYRVSGVSGAELAFCDAVTGAELCAEGAGEHAGVTNDESQLGFQLSSELRSDGCRVWNVRASVDQRPLDAIEFYDERGAFVSVDPCVALGFFPTLGFERSGGCPYGMNPGYGACGFDGTREGTGLMKWSNYCDGCRVHPGTSRGFVLQGEIYVSRIPWDAAGAHSVVCAVEPPSP